GRPDPVRGRRGLLRALRRDGRRRARVRHDPRALPLVQRDRGGHRVRDRPRRHRARAATPVTPWRVAALSAGLLAAVVALLVAVERVAPPRASVAADGRWDHYAFRGYEAYAPRPRGMLLDPDEPLVMGFRVSTEGSELVVPGLGRD